MQKIIAILNKYSILLNSVCIVFWLYIIYENYKASQVENSFDERKSYFIIPALFILLSVFNMYLVEKRKRRN